MSKRQQINREAFFETNQARTPTMVTIAESEFHEIITPFNREFIDVLKTKVPGRDRYWDKETRRWGVKNKYRAVVIEIMRNHFGGHIEETVEAANPITQASMDSGKLAQDAVAKARSRMLRERRPESLIV